MEAAMHQTLHLYLVKITCLGQRIHELRACSSSCDAVVDALTRYPQACAVGARKVGP